MVGTEYHMTERPSGPLIPGGKWRRYLPRTSQPFQTLENEHDAEDDEEEDDKTQRRSNVRPEKHLLAQQAHQNPIIVTNATRSQTAPSGSSPRGTTTPKRDNHHKSHAFQRQYQSEIHAYLEKHNSPLERLLPATTQRQHQHSSSNDTDHEEEEEEDQSHLPSFGPDSWTAWMIQDAPSSNTRREEESAWNKSSSGALTMSSWKMRLRPWRRTPSRKRNSEHQPEQQNQDQQQQQQQHSSMNHRGRSRPRGRQQQQQQERQQDGEVRTVHNPQVVLHLGKQRTHSPEHKRQANSPKRDGNIIRPDRSRDAQQNEVTRRAEDKKHEEDDRAKGVVDDIDSLVLRQDSDEEDDQEEEEEEQEVLAGLYIIPSVYGTKDKEGDGDHDDDDDVFDDVSSETSIRLISYEDNDGADCAIWYEQASSPSFHHRCPSQICFVTPPPDLESTSPDQRTSKTQHQNVFFWTDTPHPSSTSTTQHNNNKTRRRLPPPPPRSPYDRTRRKKKAAETLVGKFHPTGSVSETSTLSSSEESKTSLTNNTHNMTNGQRYCLTMERMAVTVMRNVPLMDSLVETSSSCFPCDRNKNKHIVGNQDATADTNKDNDKAITKTTIVTKTAMDNTPKQTNKSALHNKEDENSSATDTTTQSSLDAW